MLRLILITLFFCWMIPAHSQIQLKDLGINETPPTLSPEKIELQKTLEVRHSMLKKHEILGLATLGMMAATVFTGEDADDDNTHMYLGMTTGLLYFTTAYYSLMAPKPANIQDRGNIVWHKRLAWIHFPAMVLAPILGYIYKQNEEKDKESSSLVEKHGTIAKVGFGAFALSAALMTIEF